MEQRRRNKSACIVSSSADDFSTIDAASFFAMFFMGIFVHVVYLVFNWVAGNVLPDPSARFVDS